MALGDGVGSVLLVEADPAIRATHTAWLERAGYRVTAVTSYDAARHAMSREVPQLLITGVRLGAFNGLHLIIQARVATARMGAVVLASAGDRGLERDAHAEGAIFLVEPVSADTLLAAAAEAVGGLPV